ncbi:MAG: hypothetical protein GWO08_02450, partial [Gammaproteobacteria bacterium]|nr:hypothetical protein [Gammaproteobacteria bacterium]
EKFIYASAPAENSSWRMLNPADILKELHPLSFARFKNDFQDNFWANILVEGRVSLSTLETLAGSVQT